jgi:hypothetical protein
MCLALRRALQGLNDNRFDLFIADLARRARTWLVIKSLQPRFEKSGAPLADHAHGAAKPLCHRLIVQPVGAGQHHPRTPRQETLGS